MRFKILLYLAQLECNAGAEFSQNLVGRGPHDKNNNIYKLPLLGPTECNGGLPGRKLLPQSRSEVDTHLHVNHASFWPY